MPRPYGQSFVSAHISRRRGLIFLHVDLLALPSGHDVLHAPGISTIIAMEAPAMEGMDECRWQILTFLDDGGKTQWPSKSINSCQVKDCRILGVCFGCCKETKKRNLEVDGRQSTYELVFTSTDHQTDRADFGRADRTCKSYFTSQETGEWDSGSYLELQKVPSDALGWSGRCLLTAQILRDNGLNV